MILFPKIGREYWLVTDIWETHVSIPITIQRKEGGKFCGYWKLNSDDFINFEGLRRKELYKNNKRAFRAASKLNRKAAVT